MRHRPASVSAIPLTQERGDSARFDLPFYLVLLFLLLDYGRPQTFFPVIELLHPGWFVQGALFVCLISRRGFNLRYPQTKRFIILLAIMAVHVPITVNNYWAFQVFKGMFLYFIVYLSIANFIDSYPKIERFIDVWIFTNLVCAIVGIINGGKVPYSSFMGDENDFALVMNMAIPFAYFMFLQADSLNKKILYLCAVGFFVSAAVASLSRGGFIGLVAVGLFCWLKSPKKLLSMMIVILMGAVLYVRAPPTYWDDVKSIQNENVEKGTGQERWYSWQCGWRMFLDNPIIGVGQGNFPWNFERYEPPEGNAGRLHGGRAAHSIYFTLIPELGVAGTTLFFSLLYLSLRENKVILKAGKTNRPSKIQSEMNSEATEKLYKLQHAVLGIQGALVGYLVSGVFLSVLYYPHFWLLLAFSLAIAKVAKRYM